MYSNSNGKQIVITLAFLTFGLSTAFARAYYHNWRFQENQKCIEQVVESHGLEVKIKADGKTVMFYGGNNKQLTVSYEQEAETLIEPGRDTTYVYGSDNDLAIAVSRELRKNCNLGAVLLWKLK